MIQFKKAEQQLTKIKLALTGPSGAGKTYSALRMARGLGKTIALIDTENASASLYARTFDFDTITLEPPFTVEKYLATIDAAVKQGYEVLVIDSITHEWTELLEEKARLDARPNTNHWTNWAPITKKHNLFVEGIKQAKIHIIATMRSKMDHIQTEVDGKKKIQKVGMAPQQREGLEYEFSIVFDLAMNNEAEVSKDRTGLFHGKIFKITENTGEEITNWLKFSKEAPEQKPKIEAKVEAKIEPKIKPAQIVPEEKQKSIQEKILEFAPSAREHIQRMDSDIGEYKFAQGKWKDKKIKEISFRELENWHRFWSPQVPTLKGDMLETVSRVEKYINLEFSKNQPQVDEIPF